MNKAKKLLLLVLSVLTLTFSVLGLSSCQVLIGKELSADVNEMLECKHEYVTETVAPTCNTQGYDKKTCSLCGQSEKFNYTPIEHAWEIETIAPTCTEAGYNMIVCSSCGEEGIINYITASHSFEKYYTFDDSSHWIACKNCDTKKSYGAHSCDKTGVCIVCDVPILSSEGIVYALSADKTYYEVIGYEGTATKIRIADTYDNLPVKSIYEKAFYSNNTIQLVVIGNNVITIGSQAFCNSPNLERVILSDSVQSIEIGAFAWCSSLTDVKIGCSVQSIGASAFKQCTSLTEVVLPDSVQVIGNDAFYDSGLTFREYGNNGNTRYLGTRDNPFFALLEATSVYYSNYEIHANTKIIANFAFSGCSILKNITIPDGVLSIGNYAFEDCDNLTSVVIGDSVETIGDGAFKNCTSLTNVYYKGTAEDWAKISIGSNNSYLTSVTRYYYVENEEDVPTDGGNYWYYDENGGIAVW